MDGIINAQLQRTFRELQDFGEVKNCLQDLLTQLELDERDAKIEALTKELTQLKKENTILEESNARYSKLQLIEAQQCYQLQQTFQRELAGIQKELKRAASLETSLKECKEKIAESEAQIQKTKDEVVERETHIDLLKKQIRTVRFAYMNVISPSQGKLPSFLYQLPSSLLLNVYSFLDSSSAVSLSHSHKHMFTCYHASFSGSPMIESFNGFISNNQLIASLHEAIAELSTDKQGLIDSKDALQKRVEALEAQTREQERSIAKAKADLASAHNQMASDKEVKYYLDENYTRISQELTEKEELIRQMKSEFADAIKQKDAIIEENRQRYLAALKQNS
ncbi:hypothetical protein AV274_3486 [Blastocystis sp. ATCC 50177/Nand II]|uniref:Uncharacterized protein n=1 Tax=Blastocystis sp. subtype 1 (strain ATCC 50177 / NandII) TaxID=478820 RepID=A0A196SF59_BLAHN|nr:hypothetical protein AV274_3486 [Blastocystis sp. ATCC 50177/Nand II]